MRFISIMLIAGVAFLNGCASSQPGLVEAKTAPKIIVKKNKKVWDNAAYFGKVPSSQEAKGEATCASMNTDKVTFVARGYHSKALDVDGTPFPGGGFYCVAK